MRLLYGALLLGLLFAGRSATAYDQDGHYYTAYLMARDSGFTAAESLRLAMFDDYVDWDKRTDAVSVPGFEQRRLYHFPCNSWFYAAYTKRNSPWAKHNINEALKANDFVKLGMALHVYMDSYSHEGYGQVVGHLFANPIHEPDMPFLYPDKFKAMVHHVYKILRQYRVNNNLPLVEPKLTPEKYMDYAAKNIPADWKKYADETDGAYELHSVAPRSYQWVLHTKDAYGDSPVLEKPVGDELKNFYSVVDKYSLPDDAEKCDSSEWAKKGAAGYAVSLLPSVRLLASASAVSDERRVERIVRLPVKRAARFLVSKAPYLISDKRVQAHVVNAEGLGAVLDTVRFRKDPLATLIVLDGGDWEPAGLTAQLEARLDAKNIKTRLFCANQLCGRADLPEATVTKLRALYGSIAEHMLGGVKRRYLAQLLPSGDSAIIAAYAPATVDIHRILLDDPKLACGAAASLYRIGAEARDHVVPVAAELLDSIRQQALNAARDGGDGLDQDVAAELRYWQIRCYEDFDGTVHGSESDKENLARLTGIWAEAEASGDQDALQAAAIALSTYDKDDGVPQALLDEVKSAYSDPANANIASDIGYAYEQMCGEALE